jgi:outer membrane lipoprotein-sorting protein
MHVQRDGNAIRSPRRRLSVVALLCAALAIGAAPAQKAGARGDLFDELFKEGQAKNGGLKTLTASFVETTTSTLLTRPLVSSGTLAVVRPSRIVMRYAQPDDRVVLIDGDTLTMSWPSKNVRQSKDIGAAQKRIQKYFVDSSPNELRGHFTISAREATDRPGTYLVDMVPKRKQIQEGLSKLELWVDRSTQLMAAMRMTFPNGDTKLMTFTDVKPNAPVDPALFK